MRKALWILVAVLAVLTVASASKAAGDGRNFGVQAPNVWAPLDPTDTNPAVTVTVWYTEGDVVITDGVFIGPLLPGEERDIDASAFVDSGRTITANAYAERTGDPTSRVLAVPLPHTFPAPPEPGPLTAPTLLSP